MYKLIGLRFFTEDFYELDLLLINSHYKVSANLLPTSNLCVKFEPDWAKGVGVAERNYTMDK